MNGTVNLSLSFLSDKPVHSDLRIVATTTGKTATAAFADCVITAEEGGAIVGTGRIVYAIGHADGVTVRGRPLL